MLALLSTLTFAQSEATATFLGIPPGSRANAMGAAQTALADDIYALYFNPAGLVHLRKGGASFFHHDYSPFELPITFAGAAYRSKSGILGVALNNINISPNFVSENPDSYDRSLQVNYALRLSPKMALGGAVKWVRSHFDEPPGLPDVTANAVCADVGILVQNLLPHWTFHRRSETFPDDFRKFDRQSFQGLSLGLALLNTGPDRMVYIDENQGDPLPQILRLGAAFNAIDMDEVGVLLALDIDKELVERDDNGHPDGFVESWFTSWEDGFDNLRFGAEINLYHIFAFRFGRDEYLNSPPSLFGDSTSEWTFGLGFGPEWARVNLVHRSFPIAASNENWVVDFVLSY